MAEPALNTPFFSDVDAFLRWAETRDERFEYVEGRVRAMAGASRRHARIALNVGVELSLRLRDGPCAPFGPDLAIRTGAARSRLPDASVVCGDGPERYADDPVMVVEVLSPSTEAEDRGAKLREYLALPSLRHYLLLAQDAPHAELYSRADDGGWRYEVVADPLAVLRLPGIGVELPLAALYVNLPPAEDRETAG